MLNYIQNKYFSNFLSTSIAVGKQMNQSSFISEKDDDLFNCIRLFFLITLPKKNKQLIICLRLYDSELNKNFFIVPQAIFLLYDITSKDSFDSVVKFYNDLKNEKKYEDVKYAIVGNKIDLIDEENSEIESEDKEEKDLKDEKNIIKENIDMNNEKKEEKDEKEINSQNNKENNINNNKIYFKEIIKKENFSISKEISGLYGTNIEDLLNEIALKLYKMVNEMQSEASELYRIEGESTIIENKLEIDNRQKSYHDLEYKKEVKKINDNKPCCLICEIF